MAGSEKERKEQELTTYNPCPICSGTTYIKVGEARDELVSKRIFPLLRCEKCGMLVTGNAPVPSELGSFYRNKAYISHSDTHRGLTNRLYHWVRHRTLRSKYKLIDRLSKGQKGGLIVDVGAGTGFFAAYMQRKGYSVHCIEQDAEARSFIENRHHLATSPYLKEAQLPRAGVNFITLWHVLEHIPDLKEHFALFRKLLTTDGTLILALPNHTSWDAKHYSCSWAAYDVPRHLWHFAPEHICRLAQNEGFRLIEKHPMPFDAYYISLLSEQQRGRKGIWGYFRAFYAGLRSNYAARRNPTEASSLIYVFKLA